MLSRWCGSVPRYRCYCGPNPAAELKFFVDKQLSKRARPRDLQWSREGEARTLLAPARHSSPAG